MHDGLKERLGQVEKRYDGKDFRAIVNQVKKDRINDDELFLQIENISRKRFGERVAFTAGVPLGNMLESVITIAALFLVFQINSDWVFYAATLILMTTLHPLAHYVTGSIFGIRFTHYYLNGPARIEPTLRIDYSSYLKASGRKRALMHASGVIGTVMAPLIAAVIALGRGVNGVVFNLLILFLALVVFELMTSTKTGDLMRAGREYGLK
ncbi:MAG: hypothetical protein PHU34_08595 [Candidatus Methanoperedens sp.]|nr:hypothetical protein [Candidatus Methanoperedens sp.]